MTVSELFTNHSKQEVRSMVPLPAGGSGRRYWRIKGSEGMVVLGVKNDSLSENLRYLAFSEHFLRAGVRVPKILARSENAECYLVEDLGKTTLLNFIRDSSMQDSFGLETRGILKDTIEELHKMHNSIDDFPFHLSFPKSEFDSQMIRWDLNYFKYCFVKILDLEIDEISLDSFFEDLINKIGACPSRVFMMRDCQSRNIMIKGQQPYFIDFQGGLRGPAMYDLASFLNQARAGIPEGLKMDLLTHYYELNKGKSETFESFRSNFSLFSVLRTLQTLGAYGFRGLYQGKDHFIKSIVPALRNLRHFLSGVELMQKNYLLEVIQSVEEKIPFGEDGNDDVLKLSLTSFSYKQGGIPKDFSGNGGGFVFDCRGILNPGRFDDYKHLSGLDEEVITFLRTKTEADTFVNNILATISPTIENYIERGFSDLSISFGCTGGQHRSVYCAEELAKKLAKTEGLALKLNHREKPNWEKQ